MSPRCEVPLLNEISLTVAARQIIDVLGSLHADDDVSLTFVVLSSYFESLGLTGGIYQDLLNLILNSDFLDPSARFFALKLLLKENVKTLATGIFPAPFYTKILETIIMQGTGLNALNLKGVWVKDEQLHYLYSLLKSLKHLNVLNIPYIANDEVLRCIGEHSENLKLLDVSGDTDVTEIGIDAMCSGNPLVRESLTVVNIGLYGEENVCHTDVALLLQHLPNLINLGCYSFVGKSIQYLVKYMNRSDNLKLKLEYIHDTKTDIETINSIIKVCPNVETIYFEQPESGVIPYIEKLDTVNRIKLNRFPCHEFHKLIERKGHKITSLMVSQATGSLNLTHIAEKCTNLTALDCYKMDNLTHEEETKFLKLEHIEILYSNLRTSTFKYLMTCCPLLSKIIIGDEIKMTDCDMARLLRSAKFEHLEGIWFPSAPLLTRETVENMMFYCPKLQSLGQLSGWAITPDDMMLLKAIIDSSNTDLVLSPQGLFEVAQGEEVH